MSEPAWRLSSAWRHRAKGFESLRVHDAHVPAFDLVGGAGSRWWTSRQPNLLVGLAESADRVVIRYAAVSWRCFPTSASRTLARWGRQLVAAFAAVQHVTKPDELGTLLRPVVVVDVGGHARVGFRPLANDEAYLQSLPRDIEKRWPACDESALVFVIGSELMARSNVDDPAMRSIVMHACHSDRKRRYRTLDQLGAALAEVFPHPVVRVGAEARAWELFECGAGWLELGCAQPALDSFCDALNYDPDLGVAEQGRELALEVLRTDSTPPTSRGRMPEVPGASWHHAESVGLALERQRDFRAALDVYRTVGTNAVTDLALFAARARCHLALGEHGDALDYAQRALALDSSHAAALEVLTSAMLAKRRNDEALHNAERLVEITGSARAHYLRGKALFGSGRMEDARDAFERAAHLDPHLLEAQLLRREVERVTGNVRKAVRSQHAPTFELPGQLAELRDVLVGGDTGAAIVALQDTRYATDADAQLLLARFLAFERRLDAAYDAYDRLVATSHRAAALVGKATALLELGRAGDALDIFAQLPDDADAAEGAARALATLGRDDEAAAAYRRFIALATSGSDLRVRAAELWLASREPRASRS